MATGDTVGLSAPIRHTHRGFERGSVAGNRMDARPNTAERILEQGPATRPAARNLRVEGIQHRIPGVRSRFGGRSDPNAARTVLRATPSRRQISLMGTPSARCSRRIHATPGVNSRVVSSKAHRCEPTVSLLPVGGQGLCPTVRRCRDFLCGAAIPGFSGRLGWAAEWRRLGRPSRRRSCRRGNRRGCGGCAGSPRPEACRHPALGRSGCC